MNGESGLTRREFVGAAVSATAFTIVPRHVLGGPGNVAPSDILNLALIGAGGHGAFLINEVISQSRAVGRDFGGVDVVAVCDVDEQQASETIIRKHKSFTATNDAGFKRFPKARRYNDFRKLFDWEEKNIDAAVVRPARCANAASVRGQGRYACVGDQKIEQHEAQHVAV